MDRHQLKVIAKSLVEKHASLQLSEGYRPEGLHVYDDANGEIIYFRIRLKNPNTGAKWIRPFHLDKIKQEYVMSEPPLIKNKPLYRLSVITKRPNDTVWIFEGETCVEAAEKLNLLATTSGGATSANNADWTPIENRNVIIWPDNDNEGLQYSKDVINKLSNCSIHLVDISKLDLPQKADIIDWLQANPHADIEKLPLIEIKPSESSKIVYLKASDIKPRPIQWLWEQYFARGKCSMIVGDPGLGKSQLTAYITATVTQGGTWPDKTSCNHQGGVIILSAEDDPACTIVPRLIATNSALNEVRIIEAVKNGFNANGQESFKQFDLVTDIEALDEMLTRAKNIAAVIIDPISAYLGNVNSHTNSDVRFVLTPIAKLAEKHNVAIICISHLNKMSGGNAISRVSGSIAFTAASRAAFIVAKDKIDENKRLFIQLKNNLGNCKHGFAFEIEPYAIDENIRTSRIKWLDEIVTITADAALNPSLSADSDCSSLEESKEFLGNLFLNDTVIPQQAIKKQAGEAGYAWRTIERAKNELHIKSKKEGNKWYWCLPTEHRQYSQPTTAI